MKKMITVVAFALLLSGSAIQAVGQTLEERKKNTIDAMYARHSFIPEFMGNDELGRYANMVKNARSSDEVDAIHQQYEKRASNYLQHAH